MVFGSIARRRRIRGLREAMRGHRRLRHSGELDRIARIREDLTLTPIQGVTRRIDRALLGAAARDAELVTRQYALSRLAGGKLALALLRAIGTERPVRYPLPPEWRSVVRQHGLEVSSDASMRWLAFVAMQWALGVRAMLKRAIAGVFERTGVERGGPFAHFHALTPAQLPQPAADGRSHDIISWYAAWSGRDPTLCEVTHEVPSAAVTDVGGLRVVPARPAVPPPPGLKAVLRYVAWGASAAIRSLVHLAAGRWWYSFLLPESAAGASIRLQPAHRLGREYLFHNSMWMYRPLWTYEAEARGARITFYFYSTNCQGFCQPKGHPPMTYGWRSMNWPRYLVWDEEQADFVRRAVGPAAPVEIVGSIWFAASAQEMPPIPDASIAVFDVAPFRTSHYLTLGLDFEYYTPDCSERFLEDIQRAADQYGFTVVWKRKRRISASTHRRYRALGERIAAQPNVLEMDAEISAVRLIEAARLVISMPFTSTALIAREAGKPSCYYDPFGVLEKADRAAHGIPILAGPDELRDWIVRNGGVPTPGVPAGKGAVAAPTPQLNA